MLFKYLNDKLAALYIRRVIRMTPNPPPDTREEYDPNIRLVPGKTNNIYAYGQRMKDVYGLTYTRQSSGDAKEQYEMRDLHVTAVMHMKEKDDLGHEYLVLHVVVPPKNDNFYLLIERTWSSPVNGKYVMDFALEMMELTLAKDPNALEQTEAFRKARARWQEMRAAMMEADEKRRNNNHCRAVLSPIVGDPRCDHVYRVPAEAALESDDAYVVEHVVFRKKLPFVYAVNLAATVSDHFDYYMMFNHQSYFFASTIVQCLKKYAEEGAEVVHTKDVPRPEFIDLDLGQDPAPTKFRLLGRMSEKSANKEIVRSVRIPIDLYKESVFKALWEVGWLGKNTLKEGVDRVVDSTEKELARFRELREAREAAERRLDQARKEREAAEQRADERRQEREAAERKAEEERKAREAAERRMEAMLARLQAEGLSIDI